jgi:phytoene dehydrogenase-like protein
MHTVAPGRPIGGSGALTEAVRSSFEVAGGLTRCGEPVEALMVERERMLGVRLRTGEEIRAARVVVACDPRFALLDWLGEPVPPVMAGLVAKWRARPSYDGYESKVDAVIDALPQYRELTASMLGSIGVSEPLVPTTIVSPTVDGIAHAHRVGQAGAVSERPIFLVNVPSVADPAMRVTGGGHVLSLEALFTPYALRGGWPASREPRRWLEVFASKVEPGFLEGIREMRAMTPDVYERDFALPRGYAQSFAGGPVAALLGRDPELTRYRAPLEGLYLTGAATFPGAGVWGAAGRNTAAIVLADVEQARRAA